jgi:acyl-CoA reductase-like NAD-dependent aldehyde dehydrogenase
MGQAGVTANIFDVVNPATGQVIARTPLCGKDVVDAAAKAASEAFPAWRRTPVQDRVQYLFKLRDLLRAKQDEIASSSPTSAARPSRKPKPRWCAPTRMWKWPAACR